MIRNRFIAGGCCVFVTLVIIGVNMIGSADMYMDHDANGYGYVSLDPVTNKEGAEKENFERYEINRENVPGCDDPDHGTTYITYSDGTIEAVDY